MVIDEDGVWGQRRLDTAPVGSTTASLLFQSLLPQDREAGGQLNPAAVVAAFESLVGEVTRRGAVWLQDWSWTDLLPTLDWDTASPAPLAPNQLRRGSGARRVHQLMLATAVAGGNDTTAIAGDHGGSRGFDDEAQLSSRSVGCRGGLETFNSNQVDAIQPEKIVCRASLECSHGRLRSCTSWPEVFSAGSRQRPS